MFFLGSCNYVSLIYSFGYIKYGYLLFKKIICTNDRGHRSQYPFSLLFSDNCQTIFKTTYSMEVGDTSNKLVFEIENWKAVK